MFLYVSAWNKSDDGSSSFGLTVYNFDAQSPDIKPVQRIRTDTMFNVTCYDPGRGILYALEETGSNSSFRSGGGGRVFVFRIAPDSGSLSEIDVRATWSPNPCYVSTDESGKYLLVTHHGSYNAVTKIMQDENGDYYPVIVYDDMPIELFELEDDGRVGRLLDMIKCEGDGPEKRQVHAHPHTVLRSPSGRLFAVCDKGNDIIGMYGIDTTGDRAKLISLPGSFHHEPGTCPRYCAFHPEKPWFYHNSESNSKIYCFTYDESGRLKLEHTVDTLTDRLPRAEKVFEQQGFAIDREGKYLYSVVRGPNVIAVMKIDQENGNLELIQNREIGGLWPRGCALSPDGRYLFTACRDSGEVVIFRVNDDGTLAEDEMRLSNPNAAYITIC